MVMVHAAVAIAITVRLVLAMVEVLTVLTLRVRARSKTLTENVAKSRRTATSEEIQGITPLLIGRRCWTRACAAGGARKCEKDFEDVEVKGCCKSGNAKKLYF